MNLCGVVPTRMNVLFVHWFLSLSEFYCIMALHMPSKAFVTGSSLAVIWEDFSANITLACML